MIMLGSLAPWPSTFKEWTRIFEGAAAKDDLASIGIHSVAQIAARQFASQRTAFAIAGDGPTQSDLFPVLEYEAPRAFFLGITARMINRFDERTHQRDFASLERAAALNSLTTEQLDQTFGTFWTFNEELQKQVMWRLSYETLPGATEPVELRAIPCVFRSTNTPALPPPLMSHGLL